MDYRQLISEYNAVRFDYNKSNKIIKVFQLHIAHSTNLQLNGELSFYIAEHYFLFSKHKKSKHYLLSAIQTLSCLPVSPEYVSCYNLLGVISDVSDDATSALEYYLKGLQLYSKAPNKKLYYAKIAAIYNNIGHLYLLNDDYKSAIKYCNIALKYSNKLDETTKDRLNYKILLKIASAYCQCGNVKMAKKQYDILNSIDSYKNNRNIKLDLLIIQSLISIMQEDRLQLNKCTEELIEAFNNDITFDFARTIIINSEIWLKADLTQLVKLGLQAANMTFEREKNFSFMYRYYYACVLFYEKIKDGPKIAEYSIKYLHASEQANIIKRNNRAKALNQRIEVDNLVSKIDQASDNLQTDQLTGLYNRRILNNLLNSQNIVQGQQFQLGVSIIDLDNFKLYNDKLGHLAGDQCLLDVAKLLTDVCDDETFAIRYGGDEFILIFLNKNASHIKTTLEKLRQDINDANLYIDKNNNIKVTITQGVYCNNYKLNDNIYDYILKADKALYIGKKERNNIVYYNSQNTVVV